MRSTLFTLAALPLAARAIDSPNNLAVVDDNRAVELPGILKYPIKGVQGSSVLSKRQLGSNLPSQQHGLYYTIGLTIGTPGEAVDVQFDTGSSELWVNPICAKADVPANCEKFSQLQHSSTIEDLGQSHNITYGRGYAFIEYARDFVKVGSAKVTGQVFGVAKDSQFMTTGILGTGPALKGINNSDYFLVNSLHTQGFTKSIAFGVDLQGIASARGSVVFGGADLKKFRGTLHAAALIDAASAPDRAARYWINLDGISQTAGGKTTALVSQGLPVFLDTGSTLSYLPLAVVQQLLKAFPGAKQDPQSGNYIVDCALRSQDASVDFKFGSAVIKAAYKDFIYQFDSGRCTLGVTETNDESYLLGDSFLRSAYVVFDQTNKELALAQADDCGTHLVSIGPGPAGPLVGECGKPPVTSTTTSATSSTTKTTSKHVTKTSTKSSSAHSGTKTHTSSGSVTVSTGTTSRPAITSTSSHWGNSTTAKPTYTSTFTTTKVYTITSCPPTVTKCPVGHVTTETVTSLTTWCPGENTKPAVTTTVTVPGCPGGHHCPPALSTSEATGASPEPTTELVIPTETGAAPCPGCNPPTSGVAAPTGGLTTVVVPTESIPGSLPTAPVTAGAARVGAGAVVFVVAGLALL